LASENKQGADRLAFTIKDSNRKFLLDKTNIEADNKRLADELELQRKNGTSLRALREVQKQAAEKSLAQIDQATEAQRLANEKAMRVAALEKKAAVPTTVVLPKGLSPQTRSDVMDIITAGYGGTVTEDNQVIGPDGEPLKIPFAKQRELGFEIKALEAVYDNKPERVQSELGVLTSRQNKIESELKSKKSTYQRHEHAALKQQSNLNKAEIENRQKFLNKLQTNNGLADWKMKQANNIRVAARQLNNFQQGANPKAAAQYIEIAEGLEAEAVALREAASSPESATGIITKPVFSADGQPKGLVSFNKLTQEYGRDGKWYPNLESIPGNLQLKGPTDSPTEAVSALKFGQGYIKDKLAPIVPMLANIDATLQQGITTLNNLTSKYAEINSVDMTDPVAAKKLIDQTTDIMIEQHNDLASTYQEAKETGVYTDLLTGEENIPVGNFGKWKNTYWIPIVKKMGFRYNPTEAFRSQLGGQ
jgi:hypothetical protein